MSKKTISTYYCDLCGKKLSSNVERHANDSVGVDSNGNDIYVITLKSGKNNDCDYNTSVDLCNACRTEIIMTILFLKNCTKEA